MSLFYKKTAGLALCTLFSATSLYAQQSISGIVSDANGPISGATVSVKGTSRGTQTGGNGSFTIQASTGETLRISMVGYKSQEVVVGSNKTINVSLTSDQSNLEEVVVTAMGIKKAPRELGYAMSTIDSKELTKTGSPNFAGALYGKAPGVRITTAPGGATSGVNINIRGINSITGGSQPLVIIDGVPMRQNKFDNSNYWGDQRARGNGLEDLNPEDIETVSILKGASAAALYGSEAMNGVVLITTKSNKGGTGFSIDFNANYTHDQIAYLPKFQNVRGPGYSLAYANGGQAEDKFFYYGADRAVDGVTRGVLPATVNFGPKFDGLPTVAWDGKVRPYEAQNAYGKFFNNPNNTSLNLALGHATETSNVRFSLTRQDNQMTSFDSYNKKNIVNFNSTFKLWNKLTTDVVVNYINQHTHNRPFMTDRLINNFTGMISTFDNPDWYADRYQTSLGYKYVTGTNQSLTPGENLIHNGYKVDVLDYYWNTRAKTSDEYSNRLIGSFTNTYQITDDLSVRARFSADVTSARFEDRSPNRFPLLYGFDTESGFTTKNQNQNIYYTDLLASYKKQVSKDIKLGAAVGYTATKNQDFSVSGWTNGGLSQRNWYDLSASVNDSRSSQARIWSLRDATFGTLNFSFKDYWYVEGTLRRELISQMHPDNNVLYYPSVNSSLILSDAFKLPEIFDYAKLRGSWGIVGNYPNIFQSALSFSQKTLGDQGTGSVIYTQVPTSGFGNERIKPETKHEIEFGLETRLLKGRLGFDITYYNGQIKDQILDFSLPMTTGASSIVANVGTLRNKGWEFVVNGTPVQSENFKWNTTVNLAFNRNKVEQLAGGATELEHRFIDGDAAKIISRVGEPLGDIYARPVKTDDQGRMVVDANGLYQLDNTTYKKVGNAMPKAIGGFINSFSYKNFTLDALIDFRWGGHIMPTGINWMKSRGLLEETLEGMDAEHGGLSYYLSGGKGIATTGSTGPNGETVYHDGMLLDGVLLDGTKNANIISQATYFNSTYNWGGPQYGGNSRYELYVEKNNYIKMRELSLAYRLPKDFARKLKAKNISLSAFGRNLFFIYRTAKHLDPEQMTGGSHWSQQITNAGSGPATRTYGLMLRASF